MTIVAWYLIFFFVSGSCSILYELVWLRLSMAQFGVTTAMVSIVLSVFMAGLGLGSWASGRSIRQAERISKCSALRLYALTELLIGVSGLMVPFGLVWGRRLLETTAPSSSFFNYLVAGSWVALVLIPGCSLMGATIPIAMRAIQETVPNQSTRSFGYLYMSNVAGAVVGTTVPLLLIEVLGFRGTLKVGVTCNCLIAIAAMVLSRKVPKRALGVEPGEPAAVSAPVSGRSRILGLLFLTGLSSMGMELIWVRLYTPFMGTVVYAFACILAVYLLATFIGSRLYRIWYSRAICETGVLWILLACFALFPLLMASPTVEFHRRYRLVFGLMPFTGLLGFITPMLVDRFSDGDPRKAGRAYAINILGCIVGPLLAGFGLLPFLSNRWSLVLLTLPWLLVGAAPLRATRQLTGWARVVIYAALVFAVGLMAIGKSYDEDPRDGRVLRDATATVIAKTAGTEKELLVNGFGMTSLTTITKVMAHLPLAFLDHSPQNALAICFGMGTTFRSLRSWGIPVTAVELVPSVPRMFSYYHGDAGIILASPLSHVVIDDGRRYLERTSEQYDVITIDPPPPVEAAASSLLYSKEFYEVARRRLRLGGILQQWIPATSDDDAIELAAVARSLRDSFPYVRAFLDDFGIHFLGSDRALPWRTAADLLERMPQMAVKDLGEWEDESHPTRAASSYLSNVLGHELSLEQLIAASPKTPALSDDRPINEYYALRQLRWEHDWAILKRGVE
jgi:spermidine synthase